MPVRKIPRNYRSVTGYVPSAKMQRPIAYESTLERDFYLLQEFREGIAGVVEQPVRISYSVGAEKRTHVPDAILLYANLDRHGRRLELVDIKYRSDLAEHWAEYKPWLKASLSYAYARRWKYAIWTEVEIRCAELSNAKLLLPLRNARRHPGEESIHASVNRLPGLTIDACIQSSGLHDAAEALACILRLIARGAVIADLARPLTRETQLYVTS